MKVADLNAGDICNTQKMLFTKDAFLAVIDRKKDEKSRNNHPAIG
jgi:hypothetical protein